MVALHRGHVEYSTICIVSCRKVVHVESAAASFLP